MSYPRIFVLTSLAMIAFAGNSLLCRAALKHANMKELRISWDGGVWRVAFAFDTQRKRFCWWEAIKAGLISGGFTSNSFR